MPDNPMDREQRKADRSKGETGVVLGAGLGVALGVAVGAALGGTLGPAIVAAFRK